MKIERLTVAEEELMNLIWDKGQPFTSVDILEMADGLSWSGNYVHKMLRRLQDTGYIHLCGTVQYGTQYARQFEPLISRETYTASLIERQGITNQTFAKVAMAFVNYHGKNETERDKLIKELEEMVEQMKSQVAE